MAAFCVLCAAQTAHAQTFGVELHNTLMPASGGMGGVSIAQPQDLTSSVNGNPATLTQFHGTQFIFGGGWADPTFKLTQTAAIPPVLSFVTPFSAESSSPGVPLGNIGVTQDLSELGWPVTLGLGFVTSSGGFVDFRDVPQSGGTSSGSTIFNLPASIGVDVTERLSLGATASFGIAFYDGPFIRHSGMTPDYAMRGTFGANYQLNEATKLGGYYQTKQSYKFENAVLFNVQPNPLPQIGLDVRMDLPQNLGFGIANSRLLDGRLLLAGDLLYKIWDDAAMFESVYHNQWVVQLGAQYSVSRWRFRTGYVWAENPIVAAPDTTIGGVPQPGGLPAARYTEGLLAITSQNRISAGVGIVDVLPGVNFDVMAGGMFHDSQQLGPFTTTSISSYWLGAGITWRFGRGSCCPDDTPDTWCTTCR